MVVVRKILEVLFMPEFQTGLESFCSVLVMRKSLDKRITTARMGPWGLGFSVCLSDSWSECCRE